MGVLPNNRWLLSVDELWEGRVGSPWNMDGHRDYKRVFRVVAKDKRVGPVIVSRAPGIPQPGSRYVSANGVEYDLLAIATGYDCRQEVQDDWQNWLVEVKFSTREIPKGENQNNPENEPADIQWESESMQIAPMHDIKGTPYLASNELPYSPPPTFDSPFPVLSISRNEITFDLSLADYYTNALNDKSFLGWPKGRAQCLRPTATQKHRGQLAYWRVSYKIRFRRKYPTGSSEDEPFKTFDGEDDTWQPRILNAGIMELNPDAPVGAPTRQTHIRAWDGKIVSTPYLLDIRGKKQTTRFLDNNQLVPTYKTYVQYPYADLTKLLLNGVGIPVISGQNPFG